MLDRIESRFSYIAAAAAPLMSIRAGLNLYYEMTWWLMPCVGISVDAHTLEYSVVIFIIAYEDD